MYTPAIFVSSPTLDLLVFQHGVSTPEKTSSYLSISPSLILGSRARSDPKKQDNSQPIALVAIICMDHLFENLASTQGRFLTRMLTQCTLGPSIFISLSKSLHFDILDPYLILIICSDIGVQTSLQPKSHNLKNNNAVAMYKCRYCSTTTLYQVKEENINRKICSMS